MYRSLSSSRLFPRAASRAAWNACLRASPRSCHSRWRFFRDSVAPGPGSCRSSLHARCWEAPGQTHTCCQTVRVTGCRSARGHVAWQGQRHRPIVDSHRCRDTGVRIATRTCPQSRCVSTQALCTGQAVSGNQPARPMLASGMGSQPSTTTSSGPPYHTCSFESCIRA